MLGQARDGGYHRAITNIPHLSRQWRNWDTAERHGRIMQHMSRGEGKMRSEFYRVKRRSQNHLLLKEPYTLAGPWRHHPLPNRLRDHKRNNIGRPPGRPALYILAYVDALWQMWRRLEVYTYNDFDIN